MRITQAPFNTNKKISFNSTTRTTYYDGKQTIVKPFYDRDMSFIDSFCAQIKASNTTKFFREDIRWNDLAKTLDETFSNNEKVNTYNFACSDGSEPCTLAISLIENLGEKKAEKFFPIIASDMDEEIIKSANSWKFFADENDMLRLYRATNDKIDKYFKIKESDDGYILEAKNILKNKIKFKTTTFKDGLDEIKEKNNLILCRNFWGYMDGEEIIECSKKLHSKIDDTSIVLIGKFDLGRDGMPPFFLSQLGIDCATDYHGEEYILKKQPYNLEGKYSNEENTISLAEFFHFQKTGK